MKAQSRTAWIIFRWPLLLGGLNIAGLLLGLVGNGMTDVIACLLVSSPLLVVAGRYAGKRGIADIGIPLS